MERVGLRPRRLKTQMCTLEDWTFLLFFFGLLLPDGEFQEPLHCFLNWLGLINHETYTVSPTMHEQMAAMLWALGFSDGSRLPSRRHLPSLHPDTNYEDWHLSFCSVSASNPAKGAMVASSEYFFDAGTCGRFGCRFRV